MDPIEIIQGRHILIVDDEKDVLETLTEYLEPAKLDRASDFEEAKLLLESNDYDLAVLDIMGVHGFDLLAIARQRGIPAMMLTAHGLSEENLKRSAAEGAGYYAPKDEISKIATFVADVLEAEDKKKSPWVKFFMRLGGYYDRLFGGTDWREKEKEFWQKKLQELGGI
ncbi:MAG: response regulator [Thermodesulfobacteriota bacterium]